MTDKSKIAKIEPNYNTAAQTLYVTNDTTSSAPTFTAQLDPYAYVTTSILICKINELIDKINELADR